MTSIIRTVGFVLAIVLATPVLAQTHTVPVKCFDVIVRVVNTQGQPIGNVQIEYTVPHKNSGFVALDQSVAHQMCVNEPTTGQDPDYGLIKVRAGNPGQTLSATFRFALAGDVKIDFVLQD